MKIGNWTTAPSNHNIPVGDVSLHVRIRRAGERVPFVLLHGLASNSLTWEGVASRLHAAGHPVVSVDQRGHGLSEKPESGYGFDEFTADLKGLLERLALDRPPIIAGQSWGGNVVLEFAARQAYPLTGLVLVDGGFIELSARPGQTWERIAVELKPPPLTGSKRTAIQTRLRQAHPDWSDEGIEHTLGNFETLPDGTVRPWLTLDRHMMILRSLWEHRPSERYERVDVPTMIIAAMSGNAERLEEKRVAVERARAKLRRGRIHLLEADHDVHVQKPEVVTSLLLAAIDDGFFAI